MRLIRTIVVLAGAGFLLPAPPEAPPGATTAPHGAQPVSTLDMLSSAGSAVSDVAGFCLRQPEVCSTATYMAERLEAKAKYSVKLIYEWAAESTADPEVPQGTQEATDVDLLTTGTVMAAAGEPSSRTSQSTLRIDDLVPEWRGPAQKRHPAPEKKEG
jgi:hypothetical protein